MRTASLVCATVLLLSVGTAGSALAAGTPIGAEPGTTEADCIANGGTVVTDDQGNKVCRTRPGTGKQSSGREPPN
jgi:hypothetical protein